MKLLKLDTDSLESLGEVEEAGMDFWIVLAEQDIVAANEPIVVRGNGVAAPFHAASDYYSMTLMAEGLAMPSDFKSLKLVNPTSALATSSVTLPSGYTPTRGAHQLLGTVTLLHPAKFYRYTSQPTDSRFSSGTLKNGTYLTTDWDQAFANTGFGAVGRYALPLPVPASHKHTYTIPAGTTLQVGTVAPNYGQAGGGVEVKTIASIAGVARNSSQQLDDY